MLKNVVKKLSAVLAVSAMALVVFPASFKAFPPTVKDLEGYNWDEKFLCESIKENAALAATLDRGRFTRDEYCQARDKYINADLSKLPHEELANNVPMVVLAAYTTANGAPDAISYGFSDDFDNLNDCLFSAEWCHEKMQKQLCTKHRYITEGAEFDEDKGLFKIPGERKEKEQKVGTKLSLSLGENFVFEKKSNDESENATVELTPPDLSSTDEERKENHADVGETVQNSLQDIGFSLYSVEEEEEDTESDTESTTATLLDFAVAEQNDNQEDNRETEQENLPNIDSDLGIIEEEEEDTESDTESAAAALLDFAVAEPSDDQENRESK